MPGWRGVWVGLVLIVAAVLLAGVVLAAGIPHKINYQGLLSDRETGHPLVGTHDLAFRLFGAPTGGDILWWESKSVTTDQAGVFATELGSHSSLDVPFDGPCWLEIEVGGEILTPRRELVSVPYAFHAINADSLGGLQSDSYALVGHLHDDVYVNEGQSGSITGGMIADGEITDADVAAGAGIDPGKIAGTAWTSAMDGSGSGLDADLLDGQHAAAFAAASHAHDDRYYTETELSAGDGAVNQPADPVDWTKLKGVPAGFADATDNVGAGDGHSLDAADGNPTDVVYVGNDGRVLVGSAYPVVAKLHVAAGPSEDAVLGMTDTGVGTYGYSTSGVGLMGGSSSGTGVSGVSATGKAGAFTGDVYISGDLGVGVAEPTEKVDVGGNLNLRGCITMGGDTVFAVEGIPDQLRVGRSAGRISTGLSNTFVGNQSGYKNADGDRNTFVGVRAGQENIDGYNNTFVGADAGIFASAGSNNTYIGELAGMSKTAGMCNTLIGARAGRNATAGSNNTFVGWSAGDVNEGSGNVFLGYNAGCLEKGSDKLYIANGEQASKVLIYGDFTTGRIGLGTLTPERKLHILDDGPRILIESTGGNPEINLENTDDTSAERWSIYKHSTEDDLRLYQNGDRVTFEGGTGNVAIGTTDPAGYRLYVNGQAYATLGWQSSDLRLKTDLAGIDDALCKVLRLSGRSFRWRTEDYPDRGFPEGRHYGLVAQEVEEVLPEAVNSGPGGEKALAYSELIPVLVEAVKELKAENDALRERLEAIERTGRAR